MLTARDLARSKQAMTVGQLAETTGGYNHATQRRWNGQDAALVRFSMKSSTLFDGESKTNEGDPDQFGVGR
jgi:hypothetical protein